MLFQNSHLCQVMMKYILNGEYIEISSESILYLLNPSAIEIWGKSMDVEEFIYIYKILR